MKAIKKASVYLLQFISLYLITVFVLFIMFKLFQNDCANLWVRAIWVTVVAELLLLGNWTFNKIKNKNKMNEKATNEQ